MNWTFIIGALSAGFSLSFLYLTAVWRMSVIEYRFFQLLERRLGGRGLTIAFAVLGAVFLCVGVVLIYIGVQNTKS
ncbi:MAG: hypothetical protein FWG28_07760 [Clostridiales bacterium]|nr:hypothetical protein [Clostridiales bacterium]